MMKRCTLAIVCCLLLAVSLVFAKDKKDKPESTIVILWPDPASTTLKLTFEKFNQLASYNGELSFRSRVLIENVSGKPIPQASFTVYLMDKDKVRVGNGTLNVNDIDPGQQVKVVFQVFSVGVPVSLIVVARDNSAGLPTSLNTVPVKVVSVPTGANLKVDGRDVGATPKVVYLTIGSHTLEFSKEGFASGSTPVDVEPDETPGGSITFEMGGLSRDNVEMRNGTVLQGDVISVTMTSVVIRVDGQDQNYDRNRVARIVLVQRETVRQPTVVQPAPVEPKQ